MDCSNIVGCFMSLLYFSLIIVSNWSFSVKRLNTFWMLVAAWLRIIQLRYSLSLLIRRRESVSSLLSSLDVMKGGFDRVSSVDSIKMEYGLFFSGTCLSKQPSSIHNPYYLTQRMWPPPALSESVSPSALAFSPLLSPSHCHVSSARYQACSKRYVGSKKSSQLWNLLRIIEHSRSYIDVGAGIWKCPFAAYSGWIRTGFRNLWLWTTKSCYLSMEVHHDCFLHLNAERIRRVMWLALHFLKLVGFVWMGCC